MFHLIYFNQGRGQEKISGGGGKFSGVSIGNGRKSSVFCISHIIA